MNFSLKQIPLILLFAASLNATESLVGDYKLNGTDVFYTWITRADESLDALAVLQTGVDADGNPVYSTLAELGLTDIPFSYPLPSGSGVGAIRNGPLSLQTLQALGINLNLSLFEDGTGQIYEGSYYPGADFLLDECETITTSLAVTDYIEYQSDANANLTGFTHSVIGLPSQSPYAGVEGMGSFGMSVGETFDYFPANPQLVDITDMGDGFADTPEDASFGPNGVTGGYYTKGNVAPWLDADTDGDGVDDTIIQAPGDLFIAWNAVDGYASQSGLGELDFDPSQAVTAPLAEDGLPAEIFYDGVDADGESVEYWNPERNTTCILGDEDCDNTPLDRILGVTGPPIVRFNPFCGPPSSALDPNCPGPDCSSALGDMAVFGTVGVVSDGAYAAIYGGCMLQLGDEATCAGAASAYVDGCIESGDSNADTEFHVMDGRFAAWGGFFTTNGASCFATCGGLAQAGIPGMVNEDGSPSDACMAADLSVYGVDSCNLTNDSMWNLSAADPSNGGRLTFQYDATCLRVFETHEVYIDAIDITGECFDFGANANPGDVDNSCADPFNTPEENANCLNVADIVLMVQAILGTQLEFQETCRGDLNSDGIINVVDVVQTVQLILAELSIDASSAEIIKTTEDVRFSADGTVGAFQFTISHNEDFSIELTDKALVAEYSTYENKTTVVIVMPETDQLFSVNGQYEITEVLAANNNGLIESSVIAPEDFTLSEAYPNPFNPSTSLLLNLDQEGLVSVKVYNLNGQLVDILADGGMDAGLHTLVWDAGSFASGVYFIKAYIGSEVITQKVSLMK